MNRIQLRRLGALISQIFRITIFGFIALLLTNYLLSLFLIKFSEFYVTSRNIFFFGVVVYTVEKFTSLIVASPLEATPANSNARNEKPHANGLMNGENGYHDPSQKSWADAPPDDVAGMRVLPNE